MVYVGSKKRLANDLIPILTKDLKEDMYYVEPFCGGCNLIDKIDHKKKIGSDSNEYLIELLKYVQAGNKLPTNITKEEYIRVRDNKNDYPKWYVGFMGFCCSFRGIFFSSYVKSGIIQKRDGKFEDYQNEQISSLQNQDLSNITLFNSSYDTLQIPLNSIIYCDIPYKCKTGYKDSFNHDKFWQWCRDMTNKGYKIYISEYEAPLDFKCIWEKKQIKNIGAKVQNTIERLFIYDTTKG